MDTLNLIILRKPPRRLIPGTTSTSIGDMTSNGGVAASFDGATSQAPAACSRTGGSTPRGYLGKYWTGGGYKIIARFTVYAPNASWGFGPLNEDARIRLKGSHAAPTAWDGSGFGGTTLHTQDLAAPGAGTVHDVASGIDTTVAYPYHWVEIILLSGSNEAYCAEAQLYEW